MLDLGGEEREEGFGCFEGLSQPALMLKGSNRPRAIPGMFFGSFLYSLDFSNDSNLPYWSDFWVFCLSYLLIR